MKNYDQFHDGFFEGIWIDDTTVHLYLSTENATRYTVLATGVEALAAEGLRRGNIIFEVEIRESEEIAVDDIAALYDLADGLAGAAQCDRLIEQARTKQLSLLTISPSYGGSCMILASNFDLIERSKWLEQYSRDLAR